MADRTQILRTIYQALGDRDIAMMRRHVTPDVEIVERQEVPGASIYRGVDEWERGYEREGETIDDFHVDLVDVEELGGRCVADVVVRLRGRGSGAEVEERLAHLVDYEDDRVSRWRAISHLDDARRIAREECIAELYRLWAGGNADEAVRRVHPEIEWAEPEETIGAERGTGREWALQGIERWSTSFDSYSGELRAVESVGDSVLVTFAQRVRAGGSSVELETVLFHVWSFRDGLPARMRMYFERDQALNS